jgi:hypothetical protein
MLRPENYSHLPGREPEVRPKTSVDTLEMIASTTAIRSMRSSRLDQRVLDCYRTKPSRMIVAGSDRVINPDIERWYAARAKSHTMELTGASHPVYEPRPKKLPL